jgi:hypothetical protein
MELDVIIRPIVTSVYNKPGALRKIMHDESRSHEQLMNVIHCLLCPTCLLLNIFKGGMMRAFAFTNTDGKLI